MNNKTSHPLFLGLDQGSTSSKACLLSHSGKIEWFDRIPVNTHIPQEHFVEQDPLELLESLEQLVSRALTFASSRGATIAAAGLTLQRSGALAWRKGSKDCVSPILTWRDNRAQYRLEREDFPREFVYRRTGLMPAAGLAGAKLSILQRENPHIDVQVGTPDGYYLQELTGAHEFVIEESLAHRSLLYDLEGRSWDQDLCEIFDVELSRLPKVQPSFGFRGEISGIPLLSVLGDGQAALYAVVSQGAHFTYNLGTKGLMLIPSFGKRLTVPSYLSSLFFSTRPMSHGEPEQAFVLEGGTNACGESFSEICRLLNISPDEVSSFAGRGEGRGVFFCPFREITTPDWIPHPQDAVLLDQSSHLTPFDFAQGLTENVGNFIIEDILGMKQQNLLNTEEPLPFMGGISQNDFLLQYVSDCTGFPVGRTSISEAASFGAALSAKNEFSDFPHGQLFDKEKTMSFDKIFVPGKSKRKERYSAWLELKHAALSHSLPKQCKPYREVREDFFRRSL